MAIHSIGQLVKELDKLTPDETYFEILKSVEIKSWDFEKLASWNREHYTRNCIASSDEYELLLICWEKGQQSPIHDYAAREAWVHTISGSLEEQRFEKKQDGLILESSSVLKPGQYSYMDSSWIHRYRNIEKGRTMSLHLYSTPIDFWTIYDETDWSAQKVKVNYDTFMGARIFI